MTTVSTTRRTLFAGAAAGAALAAVGAPRLALAAPAIGRPAPDFTATDTKGARVSLADLRGKVVVLEWTNHDCPFVRKHYNAGNMQDLQRLAASQGFTWISIISSAPGKQGHVSAEEANRLSETRNATPAHVILDPEGRIGRAYEARTTPQMFVIGTDGALLYMGGIDSIASSRQADIENAVPYVRNAIEAIAAGRPVPEAVTRPYGCAVHYAT